MFAQVQAHSGATQGNNRATQGNNIATQPGPYKKSMGPDAPAVALRLIELTRAQRSIRDPESAEVSILESVRIFRSLNPIHPYGYEHAVSLHLYTALVDNRGDRAGAEKLMLEGLGALYRNDLADTKRAIVMARDYARMLVERANEPREFRSHQGPGKTAEVNFQLAAHWARAAQTLQSRQGELSDLEHRTVIFFQDQSIARLGDAVADGFRDVNRIRSLSPFDVLVERDEFQDLLQKMTSTTDAQ